MTYDVQVFSTALSGPAGDRTPLPYRAGTGVLVVGDHASGHLSDALRALAPRVHDVTSTEHIVSEDKISGEVVETLTVRWKRGDA